MTRTSEGVSRRQLEREDEMGPGLMWSTAVYKYIVKAAGKLLTNTSEILIVIVSYQNSLFKASLENMEWFELKSDGRIRYYIA